MECAKLLLDAGADVNSKNAKDNTPLMVAAALGHYSVLRFLIDQPNINVNAQVQHDYTCLYIRYSLTKLIGIWPFTSESFKTKSLVHITTAWVPN